MKKLLLYTFVTLGILFVVAIVAGYLGYRYYLDPHLSEALKMPPALQSPRVMTGAESFSKRLFLQDAGLGIVTDILVGPSDNENTVVIAGSQAALFSDRSGHMESKVVFSGHSFRVDIKDVDGDGRIEFVNRGQPWGSASLLDRSGSTVWSYGSGMPGVDDMAAGDFDGDGIMEYVVGFNGWGGLHGLDRKGQLQWKQSDGNVWHVEVVDTNGDARPEIVHSNAAGELIIRDAEGHVIRRIKGALYFSHFSVARWPRTTDRQYLLHCENDTIWLLDFDGKNVAQFSAPHADRLGGIKGTLVKFYRNQAPYFAVLWSMEIWQRSILYIFDTSGSLVFQEILAEAGSSLTPLSFNSGGTETLLVGGRNRVWHYALQQTGASKK